MVFFFFLILFNLESLFGFLFFFFPRLCLFTHFSLSSLSLSLLT
jgi:hypothetical protein